MAAENYYDILGLRRGADDEAVKQAFRELAKTLHPDRNPNDPDAERRFKLVSTAYEALKDDSRRRAYDEWLAFARKHERSKLAQWSRLVAMVVLLLLGPSIALYWAFVLLDKWDRPVVRPPVTATAPKPKPAERKTAIATRNAATGPEAQTASHIETAPAVSPVAKTVQHSEIAKQEPPRAPQPTVTARQEPPATPAHEKPAEPVSKPQAASPDVTAALPAREERTVVPPPPVPAPEQKTAVKPAEQPAPPEKAPDTTESVPEAAAVWGVPEKDDDKQNDQAQQEARSASRTPGAADDAQESAARSMARVIAESKESIATPPRRLEERRETAATPKPATTPRRIPPSELWGADDFADCERCPVMSVVAAGDVVPPAPRPTRARQQRNLAISKVEVTVAQWNACVQDGACKGLHNAPSDSADKPVRDVTRSEASRYTEWLTRKTGRPYKVMKVGGWEQRNGRRESEPQARPTFGPQDDCSAPDWDWIEDSDCAKQRRAAAQARELAERAQHGDPSPYEASSGFRVSRTLGPDG